MMDVNQYINQIARKLKCSKKRKNEIKKELMADFDERMAQGEQPKDIIIQMGSAKEIANSFNEDLPKQEKRAFLIRRGLSIAAFVAILLIVAAFIFYWFVPKVVDISNSRYFEQSQVEKAMEETVTLLDMGDYSALQANAIEQMKTVLSKEKIEPLKAQISEDWGERKGIGKVYINEVVQRDKHYVVGEMTVLYENINIIYTLSYDQDMRLAGLYMR